MPTGDVQLGRDDLAGLADLHVVRHVAGIDRGARGADAAPSLSARLVDDREVLGRAERAAAGDHAAALCRSGRSLLALLLQADEAGVAGQRDVDD
jgi:hypothetical protein